MNTAAIRKDSLNVSVNTQKSWGAALVWYLASLLGW